MADNQSETIQIQTEKPTSNAPATPANVVIVRERELDCDVATAIGKIRADADTAGARILIVAPEDDGPPSESTPTMPASGAQQARRGEAQALRQIGDRLGILVGCLERFGAESADALSELTDACAAIELSPNAADRLRTLREIQDWTRAVVDDLRVEATLAQRGFRPLSTHDLLAEAAAQVESRHPSIRVTIAPEVPAHPCWGRAAELTEALFLAMDLTAQRIGGVGGLLIEVVAREGWIAHRMQGHGVPESVHAPQTTARLRHLVVQEHDGRLRPGEFGGAGAGIELELPIRG